MSESAQCMVAITTTVMVMECEQEDPQVW